VELPGGRLAAQRWRSSTAGTRITLGMVALWLIIRIMMDTITAIIMRTVITTRPRTRTDTTRLATTPRVAPPKRRKTDESPCAAEEEDEEGEGLKRGGGKWIAGAIKHHGALHKQLGVPQGEKIPAKKLAAAKHSDNPTLRKRANLASTLKKMHH
jgi:hypothetical protein